MSRWRLAGVLFRLRQPESSRDWLLQRKKIRPTLVICGAASHRRAPDTASEPGHVRAFSASLYFDARLAQQTWDNPGDPQPKPPRANATAGSGRRA